ncbi:hypothetical protein [Yinghuangia sp. YIM S10712]|uniref:hypothetical protein n=1 Tax=Yinghuangia sp. YIM S10712 TaxID=3436930 RepID=UPI003F539A7C
MSRSTFDSSDNRKVQTAIFGSAGSDEPALLPQGRDSALRFRRRHGHHTFWCGELLGGCGAQLSARIPGDRVAHFMHHPDVNGRRRPCSRIHIDEHSADHLYVRHALVHWLSGLGFVSDTRYGDPAATGADIFVPALRVVLAVRLSGHNPAEWELQNARLRQGGWHTDWILGPQCGFASAVREHGGTVWRSRCSGTGIERATEIGTADSTGAVRWTPFAELSVTSDGLLREGITMSNTGHRKVPGVATTAPPRYRDPVLDALEEAFRIDGIAAMRRHYMAIVWRMWRGNADEAMQLRAKLTR